MNFHSDQESKSNSKEEYFNQTNDEFELTPRKRSRPSLSHRLDLIDQFNVDQTKSFSNHHFQQNHQNTIRQSQISFDESKLISNQQHSSESILQLLEDVDEEEDDDDEIHIDNDQQVIDQDEAYSPSQLDRDMMNEVSDQLKINLNQTTSNETIMNYIPPSINSIEKQDIDYRDQKKINHEISSVNCRLIPIHNESVNIIDPRFRIYSNRLHSKVRQLVLERLSKKIYSNRNEILEELDHLVESHGRRLYWYRLICFLQNISLNNNSSRQNHFHLKELSRLLVLTPNISKILKIKQKYPKIIPIDCSLTNQETLLDPRSTNFHLKFISFQSIVY